MTFANYAHILFAAVFAFIAGTGIFACTSSFYTKMDVVLIYIFSMCCVVAVLGAAL